MEPGLPIEHILLGGEGVALHGPQFLGQEMAVRVAGQRDGVLAQAVA